MCTYAVFLFSSTRGVGVKRYDLFVGRRVEARYRAGYIYHSATGTPTVNNGSSIFIEDRFVQDGRDKTVRVEIPYECVMGIAELCQDQRPNVWRRVNRRSLPEDSLASAPEQSRSTGAPGRKRSTQGPGESGKKFGEIGKVRKALQSRLLLVEPTSKEKRCKSAHSEKAIWKFRP